MKYKNIYKQALKIIPGGTQLYSKRPELFLPDNWPTYYSRAKGIEVVDLKGKRYLDMSIFAVGACVLGYADKDVDKAVKKAIDKGNTSTLNCWEEVELAKLLCQLHPWAKMVRYARGGGEAVAIAIRIARAYTRKDKIAFCGYHGWHDWYLAANLSDKKSLNDLLMPGLSPCGVPSGLKNTALPFHYGKIKDLKRLVKKHGNDLAAIILEPARDTADVKFLKEVKRVAKDAKAVLIFDEITSGFKMNCGGIHLLYNINPDMAVFSKAIGNGYPIAAVIGKRGVMQASQNSFISSTNWTERIGTVAALATIRKFKKKKVASHLIKIGKQVQQGWQEIADKTGIKIKVSGLPPLSHFSFDSPDSLVLATFFTQEMLKKGFLAWTQFKASFAHKEIDVKKYFKAVEDVFVKIKQAKKGSIKKLLKGPVAKKGFYRLVSN